MSGAFAIARTREYNYELYRTQKQRQRQAQLLRALYAMCDHDGWDARRLKAQGRWPAHWRAA